MTAVVEQEGDWENHQEHIEAEQVGGTWHIAAIETANHALKEEIPPKTTGKNILNEDQYGKWREIQKTRQSKMAKRRGHGSRGEYSKKG